MFNWLKEAFFTIIHWFLSAFLWFVDIWWVIFVKPWLWIISKILGAGLGLLDQFFEKVNFDPAAFVYSEGYQTFYQYSGFINYLIDIPAILIVSTMCITWLLGLAATKFCIKLIPTVG
jgi:hypothetical protein